MFDERELSYIKSANPIFLHGLANEENIQAGFARTVCLNKAQISDVRVYVTAGTFYRLYVNGHVAAHGPARAAEGDLRVDLVDVSPFVYAGENIFAFEVTSHGNPFDSYSNEIVCAPGLLACAIVSGDEVVDKTDETWRGIHLAQRRRFAERISHCRENAEVYDLDAAYEAWKLAPEMCEMPVGVQQWIQQLLPRGMSMPTLDRVGTPRLVYYGGAYIDKNIEVPLPWFENPHKAHFDKLTERPGVEYVQTVETALCRGSCVKIDNKAVHATNIPEDKTVYLHYDFMENNVAFIGIDFETKCGGVVDIVHLENYGLYDNKEGKPLSTNPVTRLHVPAGRFRFLTMEPGLFRYIKLYFRGTGDFHINDLYALDYTYPDTENGSFQCSDDDLNRLYMASRRTLKLNTLDIFMDCPERERGGWLCDSLWTARAQAQMLGDSTVEKAFIENYLRADPDKTWNSFFPEVYPATKKPSKECNAITTWSFWLMIELCEYTARTGDTELALKYQDRVEAFVNSSMNIIGPSGLLENMPCIFIDWSTSNKSEHTQPISTAANALYIKMLCDLGALYGRQDWIEKGNLMRRILCGALLADSEKSPWSRPAFPDSISYDNGTFRLNGYYSEAAQYLIFWSELFDGIELTPKMQQSVSKLREKTVKSMGVIPEFAPSTNVGGANLFIGLCIRLDMLAKMGQYDILLKELKALYYPQLQEGPGTLWETRDIHTTSRCHGFTAHAGVHLTRDILGLGIPNEKTKTIRIVPHPCGLRWARGVVATSDGLISLMWTTDGGFECKSSMPDGWKIEM